MSIVPQNIHAISAASFQQHVNRRKNPTSLCAFHLRMKHQAAEETNSNQSAGDCICYITYISVKAPPLSIQFSGLTKVSTRSGVCLGCCLVAVHARPLIRTARRGCIDPLKHSFKFWFRFLPLFKFSLL